MAQRTSAFRRFTDLTGVRCPGSASVSCPHRGYTSQAGERVETETRNLAGNGLASDRLDLPRSATVPRNEPHGLALR